MNADVPLSCMFGYASEIRSIASGQGEFSLEYKRHDPVQANEIE